MAAELRQTVVAPPAKPWRRRGPQVVVLLALVLFALWLYPIGTHLIRAAMAVVAVALWMAVVRLYWRRTWWKIASLLPIVVLILIAAKPVSEHAPARLRTRFVAALQSYEGTRYVWGGENGLGIDCSGLVRRALGDAFIREALATGNLGMVRESMLLRWFDTSAKGLLQEYRGQTRRLFDARSVRELALARLQPGDFVVTADGIHVMAFLGGTTWIAADPQAGRVIRLQPGDNNPWLLAPVVVMTWRALEGQR